MYQRERSFWYVLARQAKYNRFMMAFIFPFYSSWILFQYPWSYHLPTSSGAGCNWRRLYPGHCSRVPRFWWCNSWFVFSSGLPASPQSVSYLEKSNKDTVQSSFRISRCANIVFVSFKELFHSSSHPNHESWCSICSSIFYQTGRGWRSLKYFRLVEMFPTHR